MGRINYQNIVFHQDCWKKEIGIPKDKTDALIALSNKLMHKAIDNNHEIDGIKLLYPEDCDNKDVFMSLAYAFSAFVHPKEEGKGFVMEEFGKNREELDPE